MIYLCTGSCQAFLSGSCLDESLCPFSWSTFVVILDSYSISFMYQALPATGCGRMQVSYADMVYGLWLSFLRVADRCDWICVYSGLIWSIRFRSHSCVILNRHESGGICVC